MDDLGLERERRLVARESPPVDPPGGAAAFTGKVTTAAGSIAVGKYLMVNPVTVTGAETEGGAGSFAVDTGTFVPVYLVGPGTPATGDYLLCRQAGSRWVAEKTGGARSYPYPGCSCATVPGTVWMTEDDPTKNLGYFQNNVRISYQAMPSWMSALSIDQFGNNMQWISDPTAEYTTTVRSMYNNVDYTCHYCWHFYCLTGLYAVERLYRDYPDSVSAGTTVFRDGDHYHWSIGLGGNTCTPFNLQTGTIVSGFDTTEHVYIKDHNP